MRCSKIKSSRDKVPTEHEGINKNGQNQEPLHKQDLKAMKRFKLRNSGINICYIWMTTVFF
jgi:hypothetical protein